jgi:hypothetical protein
MEIVGIGKGKISGVLIPIEYLKCSQDDSEPYRILNELELLGVFIAHFG